MNQHHNKALTENAQRLRREMTNEERHLWYDFLKQLPVTVKRQKVIDHYIVDFFIASANIVIELDGSQHYEPKGTASDLLRDQHLRKLGYRILRYSNADINLRFRNVCEDIWNHIPQLQDTKP